MRAGKVHRWHATVKQVWTHPSPGLGTWAVAPLKRSMRLPTPGNRHDGSIAVDGTPGRAGGSRVSPASAAGPPASRRTKTLPCSCAAISCTCTQGQLCQIGCLLDKVKLCSCTMAGLIRTAANQSRPAAESALTPPALAGSPTSCSRMLQSQRLRCWPWCWAAALARLRV